MPVVVVVTVAAAVVVAASCLMFIYPPLSLLPDLHPRVRSTGSNEGPPDFFLKKYSSFKIFTVPDPPLAAGFFRAWSQFCKNAKSDLGKKRYAGEAKGVVCLVLSGQNASRASRLRRLDTV